MCTYVSRRVQILMYMCVHVFVYVFMYTDVGRCITILTYMCVYVFMCMFMCGT